MSEPALDNGIATLTFARQAFLSMLEDIPEDKLTFQPFSGANHALWNIGHIAVTDDYFMSTLNKRSSQIPARWNELFGMGSKPSAELGDYPPLGELRSGLHNLREELFGWFRSMSAEQLAAPLPKEQQGFAPCFGALMSTVAWHEGMHTGQVTAIRKSLGMAPKFG